MKKTILIFSVFTLLSSTLHAQFQIPEGFSKIESVQVDIDGDGKKDTIAVIRRNEYPYCHRPLIYLTSNNKNQVADLYVNAVIVEDNVIRFYFITGSWIIQFAEIWTMHYNHYEGRIQLIGFESSTSSNGGTFRESYNLLTGDYLIINRRRRRDEERREGNEKIETIFFDDFDRERRLLFSDRLRRIRR